MACAVDASSPIRFTGAVATGANITSAAFTAPANSFLVLCLSLDGNGDGTTPSPTASAVADSGTLTWTKRVERGWTETTLGGESAIWTAPQVSSASRTVTVNITYAGGGTVRLSAKLYVVTGADISGTPVDTVGANNEGGSATNNLTTSSLTPGANGLLFASDTDWLLAGAFDASTDLTEDTATYASAISVDSGFKTCTSGVGVTANLNAGGAGSVQHKWCQIIVREAAAGATKAPPPFSAQKGPRFYGPQRRLM